MIMGVARLNNKRFLIALLALALVLPLLFAGCSNAKTAPVQTAVVPEATGLTFEEAQARLGEAGFEVTKQEQNSQAVAGTVVSTDPGAGEELAIGETVAVLTSKGPQMVSLPSLAGMTEAQATGTLSSLGLQGEVQRNFNEQVENGLVYWTEPAPQAMVPAGSKVIVKASLGSAYVTCPTCGGKRQIRISTICPDCGGSGVCYT